MNDFNYFVIARSIHVLAVVLWIGGVAFITMVLLPALLKLSDAQQRIELFEQLENKFAFIAKVSTLATGMSGSFMLEYLNAWHWYLEPSYWWLHLMTFVWLVFTLVLFVLEPLFLHRWFLEQAKINSEKTFSLIFKMHQFLFFLSAVAILAAMTGAHGLALTG